MSETTNTVHGQPGREKVNGNVGIKSRTWLDQIYYISRAISSVNNIAADLE